ncbi:MAG TPA: HAMP domain-containing sensor histidine kinase [Gemmatimonadaceae bacterium]|nr:HAMP domain-containing sensor histidine kinase [Gemmatimonadaceae bacterium]
MIPSLTELHIALAIAPFAGVMAIRELWSRRRQQELLQAREEEARRAKHEAMRTMQEALAAAEAAQRSRDEFLARMSHELRTPLNAVIGFSRVLEKNNAGNQRPEDIHLLGRVRAGGEQLLRLVDDVLDQSRIERGQLTLALDAVNVVEVAARVVANYRSAAVSKGLRILAVLPPTAGAVPLDEGRFEQVVQHLVDNAVKFTGSGVVKITLVTDAATLRPTRLIVADTGIGIPANRLGQIFIPFEQVQASTDRAYGGAGLGLPLARQLCEGMGCRLSVESEVGTGSRFTIRFPNP